MSGVAVTLFGRSGILSIQTNARGIAEWKSLRPGRYRVSASKEGLLAIDPDEALASVEIPAGACARRIVTLQPFLPSSPVSNPDPK
jgi:hypothetical protein